MNKLFLLILIPLFFISCSEEPTGPSGSDADKLYSGGDLPIYFKGHSTNISTGEETYFFTARLIFQIGNIDYLDYNTKKYFSVLINNIYAQFDKNHQRFSEVKINDSSLTAREDSVVFQGGGIVYPDKQEGIKLYFGNTPNHIFIKGNDCISEIDTNIFLMPMFEFTNMKSGDTINGSKNFAVKWNGITENFARFYIHEQDVDNEKAFWYEGIIKNDGEFIFTTKMLDKAPAGTYFIAIERIEPHTIELKDQLPLSILVKQVTQKRIYLKK
jgi:hypothetical protein